MTDHQPPCPVVIGYSVQPRTPDAGRSNIQIKPPGNLKKQESIDAWWADETKQAEAWAKYDALAPWTKLTGAIKRVVMVDIMSGVIFDSDTFDVDEPVEVGAAFVKALLNAYEFPLTPGDFGRFGTAFYGFNPKPLFRIAGQNAIRAGLDVPLTLWYSGADNHVYDPKEMLLESEVKTLYSLEKILAEAPGGPIPVQGFVPHRDPMEDVRLTVEICTRYGLFGSQKAFGDRVSLEQLLAKQPCLAMQQDETEDAEAETEAAEAEAEDAEVETETAEAETTKKKPAKKKKPASTAK